MLEAKIYNVLFLCTHNSARSLMAEVILDYVGRGRFKGYSAGSLPSHSPNPHALKTLRNLHFPTNGLFCKHWREFENANAPVMDFVFTVCDRAAGEICPVWPGRPITAHWGVEDPADFHGPDEETLREFGRVANVLKRRIELLVSLPLAKLDNLAIHTQVRDIGKQ